jgi:peptide/nickel transport system substrate-binding protein
MIPQGIAGHINAFYNLYGDPNRSVARALLQKANVSIPVHLTLAYTSDHYGAATADEFAELKQQLEASGLFKVRTEGKEWEDFQKGYTQRDFQVFGMGWFPDFPDPDNYIAPFMQKKNFLNSPYTNSTILNTLLPDSRRQAQRSAAVNDVDKTQNIIAQDVPLLPLWQGKQYVAARGDVTGTAYALNSSSTLQLWELGRGVSG